MTLMSTDEILRSESSDCVKLLLTLITYVPMRFTTHIDFKNGGLHGTHNKMRNTLFSWNYEVGSADGGDDGDDVDFEHPDSDGSFDFHGKNYGKSS